MTFSDERSSEKRDWNDLFARLCCVASYLRERDDVPGSDFTLDQELYDATFVFLTDDDSPDGRALRESKWFLKRTLVGLLIETGFKRRRKNVASS